MPRSPGFLPPVDSPRAPAGTGAQPGNAPEPGPGARPPGDELLYCRGGEGCVEAVEWDRERQAASCGQPLILGTRVGPTQEAARPGLGHVWWVSWAQPVPPSGVPACLLSRGSCAARSRSLISGWRRAEPCGQAECAPVSPEPGAVGLPRTGARLGAQPWPRGALWGRVCACGLLSCSGPFQPLSPPSPCVWPVVPVWWG